MGEVFATRQSTRWKKQARGEETSHHKHPRTKREQSRHKQTRGRAAHALDVLSSVCCRLMLARRWAGTGRSAEGSGGRVGGLGRGRDGTAGAGRCGTIGPERAGFTALSVMSR